MSGTLTVTCPSCGATGRAPESFVGHLIHCKHCDQHFRVEEPAPAPVPGAGYDEIELAPMDPDEEQHLRQHYEARIRTMLKPERLDF
jgi:hypothetical protein